MLAAASTIRVDIMKGPDTLHDSTCIVETDDCVPAIADVPEQLDGLRVGIPVVCAD